LAEILLLYVAKLIFVILQVQVKLLKLNMLHSLKGTYRNVQNSHYYRAMHFSAKRGIAIACRLSVRDVGGSGWKFPHRFEILETNYTDN